MRLGRAIELPLGTWASAHATPSATDGRHDGRDAANPIRIEWGSKPALRRSGPIAGWACAAAEWPSVTAPPITAKAASAIEPVMNAAQFKPNNSGPYPASGSARKLGVYAHAHHRRPRRSLLPQSRLGNLCTARPRRRPIRGSLGQRVTKLKKPDSTRQRELGAPKGGQRRLMMALSH